MGRQSSFHKLFIFFGTDIERYGHKFLQESHSQGYTLLPLDSSAVGFARGAKLPFGLIDEYVGLDALLRSRREATEFYWNWFKPAGSEFTSDDICWPEFDLEAMRWFWRDVATTFELAEAFQRRGGSQLQFFHQEVLRPSVFYYRNDIHAVILNQLFPNKALPVSIPEAKVKNSIDYLSRMRITFDDTSGRPLYNPDIFKDRIVLAFNPGESHRFGHVIEQLTREFPGEVAVMLIFPSSAYEKKLSEKYSIPVVSPRQLDFMEPEYQSRFFNGYNKLVQNTPGRLGWTINVLKYHFDNYCRYRWPAFVSNFHTWLNLWKRIRPKAVVVSALSDGESQLPAETANRYDIPTFAIPHGAAFVREKTSKVVSKYMLYSLDHQKTHFRKNGVAPDRLICCRNLRAINEHPVVVRKSFGEKKNWRILALMNPTKIDSVINPTIEPSKQIEALKILDKPPADITGQISLIVKVHPGFPELELVSSVSSSLAKKILPPDTDLQTVVEQVDLVVAVNYFGSALVQVLCSGKPVIFLTTDRLMKAIQSIDPNYNIYLLPSTFNTVGTGKELWDVVRRHFTDGQYAQQMRLQSRQFYRENLDDSKYPTIGRVIKEVLSKSQDKIIKAETVECSVIVPTYNRSVLLKKTIASLVRQDFEANQYEILIVDNGSTDSTRQVAQAAISAYQGHNIRYIFEPEPGLLSGRHKGALEAKGEILVFVDDDIKAVKGWLSAIAKAFSNESVHLVGGPSLPEFETQPPAWTAKYWNQQEDKITCGSLSLILLNTNVEVEIDPNYVWGLNFSIRKKTLFELGGFHPDCIPKALQHFQGDGEAGLTLKLKAKSYRAIYAPGAKVYHYIPKERLTVDYFKKRFFYQGVCESYTQIRRNRGFRDIKVPEYKPKHPNLQNMPPEQKQREAIYREIHNELVNGFRFHIESVSKGPALLEWVLREDYFDYKLPELPTEPTGKTYNLPSAGQLPSKCNISTDRDSSQHYKKLLKRAYNLIGQNNFAPALNLLEQVKSAFAHTENFQYARAVCLWRLDRFDEAAIAAQQELDRYPGNDYCRRILATYHHEQVPSDPELLKWTMKKEYFKSENSSIEAQLRQFEAEPNLARAYNSMGVLYRQMGQIQKSLMYFSEALKLNPADKEIVLNSASVLKELDYRDVAGKICSTYLQIHPDDRDVILLLKSLPSGQIEDIRARDNIGHSKLEDLVSKPAFGDDKDISPATKSMISKGRKSELPRSIQISLSDCCNFRCTSCWIHGPKVVPNANNFEAFLFKSTKPCHMDLEVYRNLINDIAQNSNPVQVQLCGKGEPTIHPNFLEMVMLANEKELESNLVTNGSMLTFDMLKTLCKTRLKGVNISLNACDPVSHRAYSNIYKDYFTQIVEIIKQFNASGHRGLKINLSFVIGSHNIAQVKSMAELSSSILLPGSSAAFYAEWTYPENRENSVSKNQFTELLTHLPGIKANMESSGIKHNLDIFPYVLYGISLSTERDYPTREYYMEHPCKMMSSFLAILADGRVVPCCRSSYVLGDIKQQSIFDILDSDTANDFRYQCSIIHKKKCELPQSHCYSCDHLMGDKYFSERYCKEVNDLVKQGLSPHNSQSFVLQKFP